MSLSGPGITTSRKELAYEVLRDRILSLQLEANAAIYENDIAEELGISRTPVREALAALDREGLVRIVRGKGAFVAPASADRALESFEVREVLEGLAGRLATGRFEAEELKAFKTVFAGHLAGDVSDAEVLLETADRLHHLIWERSGNNHLQYLLKQMSDQIKRLRNISMNRASRMEGRSQEHLDIILALESGDPDRTEAVMRNHIRSVRNNWAMLLGRTTQGGVVHADS